MLHLDAYRINHAEEVDELGLDEAVETGDVLVVEWAERIKKLLPEIDLRVVLTPTGDQTRSITVEAHSVRGEQLLGRIAEGRIACNFRQMLRKGWLGSRN